MTAPIPTEGRDNVIPLFRHPVEPPRPPMLPSPWQPAGVGKTPRPAARSHLARCWRRSQLRRDLIDYAVVIGFALAVLVGLLAHDHITQLAHALTGGLR